MNFKIIPLLLVFLTIFLVGVVQAVECNADLSQGGDSCTVSSSLTLNTGTYYKNGSSNVMQINGNNIILDGNGSTFIGNYSDGGTQYNAIYTPSHTNITIKNITLVNYYRGILSNNNSGIYQNINLTQNYIGIGLGTQTTPFNIILNITDSVFNNNSYRAIQFNGKNISLVNILNSNFTWNGVAQGIYEENNQAPANISIGYCNFYQGNTGSAIRQSSGYNWNIYNNNVYGSSLLYSYGFDLRSNQSNSSVTNNYIEHTQYNVNLEGAFNVLVQNNTFINGDEGSAIGQADLIYFYNNTIRNMTNVYDGYYIGLWVQNSSRVYVEGNNFNETGISGVVFKGVSNSTIKNNQISGILFSDRNKYSYGDGNTAGGLDFGCGIKLVQTYKGFFPKFSGNSNITISGNTINNFQCYLQDENGTSINLDISDFWYRSYSFPSQYVGKTKLYLNNNYNNISSFWYDTLNVSHLSNYFNFRLNGPVYSNITINKDYMLFINSNDTELQNNTIYSLTSALIFNTNGSIQCGGLVTGQCNITLAPNNASYVLDNFNLTEGVSKENSPLDITQKTTKSLHITSTLTDTISGLSVTFELPKCESAGKIIYTSHTGDIQTFNKDAFSCNGDYTTITLNNIDASLTSNLLEWTYGCSAFERAGYNIIRIAGALIIFSFVIFMMWKGEVFEQMTAGGYIMLFIGIAVGIGLFIGSADIIAQTCVP